MNTTTTNHTNAEAYDLAVSRVREAINMLIVAAMSTSSDSPATPAPEVVSLALDGVAVLLKQAESALINMHLGADLRAA